mgnify:CR=1 FL=1
MDVKVRVYLKSEIMEDPKFMAKHHSDKRGHDVAYFFNDLRIHFSDGCFYMDTIGGQVPEALKSFMSGKYSIHDYYLPGFRHGGLYRDARFDQTEAQVKQCNTSQPQGSDCYNIEIDGTDLEHVLGLYHAILNDELLPVSVGKSPVQIIEELKANLLNSEREIFELTNKVAVLENQLDTADKTIDSMREEMSLVQEIKRAQLEKAQAQLQASEVKIALLSKDLAEAKKPWHEKLRYWYS